MKDYTSNDQKMTVGQYILYFNIGSGGQSNVYYAIENSTGKAYAIKLSHNESFEQTFTKEVEYMCQLKHEYIINNVSKLQKFEGKNKTQFYYAMELAPEGNLFESLQVSNKGMPENIIKFYTNQIVTSLDYIFSQSFCHNDLKLENI